MFPPPFLIIAIVANNANFLFQVAERRNCIIKLMRFMKQGSLGDKNIQEQMGFTNVVMWPKLDSINVPSYLTLK